MELTLINGLTLLDPIIQLNGPSILLAAPCEAIWPDAKIQIVQAMSIGPLLTPDSLQIVLAMEQPA